LREKCYSGKLKEALLGEQGNSSSQRDILSWPRHA